VRAAQAKTVATGENVRAHKAARSSAGLTAAVTALIALVFSAPAAAIAHGLVIVHDLFFVIISCANFCGCSAVTATSWTRRRQWSAAQLPSRGIHTPARPANIGVFRSAAAPASASAMTRFLRTGMRAATNAPAFDVPARSTSGK
jgi:hypothetical protein